MSNLTWLGIIEQTGTTSKFVEKSAERDGYLFTSDKDRRALAITEMVRGDSSVIVSLKYDEDGELEYAEYFGERYDSTLFIEEELKEFLELLQEDGVIAYDD